MKVIFYQPVSFLRSAKKTNPFFDPIIEVCRKNGIDWELWLPDARVEHGYEKSHVRDMRWFYFFDHLFYRIFHYVFRVRMERAQTWSGFLLRQLTFHRFKADLVISIAGCLVHVMKSFFPHVRAADVQHGVVYSRHKGYFDPHGRIWSFYWTYPEREFWLYGPGYADCFFKNPENHRWLDGRVKVIGDVVRAGGKDEILADIGGTGRLRNVIAFSAQLTHDLDAATLDEMVRRMVAFFEGLHARYGSAYRYVFKQHPRFGKCCDIAALAALSYVEQSDKPWTELYPQMALHVTFSSTVTFDAASVGVPTCHPPYPENKILDGRFYGTDFGYPFAGKTVDELLALMKHDVAATMRTTRDWFLSCHAPFDEKTCLSLLKNM